MKVDSLVQSLKIIVRALLLVFAFASFADEPPKPVILGTIPDFGYAGSRVYLFGEDFGDSLGKTRVTVSKTECRILHWSNDTLLIRLPGKRPEGKAKIRVFRDGVKSKPYRITIKALNVPKIVRFIVGGMAFLLLGVFTLTAGLKKYASRGLRNTIHRTTGNAWATFLGGVSLSGLSQSSTSASLLLLSLVNAGLIDFGRGFLVLAGANIGSTITALVLQFTLPKYGILVISVGVIMALVTRKRRYRWYLTDVVLGIGFLFYGVHVLKNGVSPLESHPFVIEFFANYSAHTPKGFVLYFLAGVLSTVMFQSSGAAVALLIGASQTTRIFTLDSCILFILGTNIGVVLTTAFASRFGAIAGKRLVWGQLIMNGGGVLIAMAMFPFLSSLVDGIVPGSPQELQLGKKVIHPLIASHITMAFFTVNLICSVPFLIIMRPMTSWIKRRIRGKGDDPGSASVWNVEAADEKGLHRLSEKVTEMTVLLRELMRNTEQLIFTEQRELLRPIEVLQDLIGKIHRAVVSSAGRLMQGHSYGPEKQMLEKYMYCSVELNKATILQQRKIDLAMQMQEEDIRLDQEMVSIAKVMGTQIDEVASNVVLAIQDPDYLTKAEIRYQEITVNRTEENAKKSLIESIGAGKYNPETGNFFLQLISFYEQTGNQLYRILDYIFLERTSENQV